jgi:ParB-like chromosome segregation protein Spo0J
MQIERRRLDSLQLDPDNAREHDKANIDAIKASLKKFGQRKPIVVADGVVIAGNGTMEAAQALGWEEIDTVSADDLDETERRAYAIADNRTAELAKWNQEKLAEALSSVTEDGDAMGEATGFEHEAIMSLLKTDMPEFDPVSEEEQSQLDEKKIIVCPHCGKELGQGFHK